MRFTEEAAKQNDQILYSFSSMDIIISAPSLDPAQNVSGVSSVVNFIIDNNLEHRYIHFELGKKDAERGGIFRIGAILKAYKQWKKVLVAHPDAVIHYSFPLSALSILRDYRFIRYAYKTGRKMVVHIHGGNYMTAKKIPALLNRMLKDVFSWDVPFIVLSEKERYTVMERFGAKRVFVLPNTVDLKEATRYRRTKKSEGEPLILGYIGRIEPNKGMTELLEACKQLHADGIPFQLRIAGKEERQGEYLPLFESLPDGCFKYAGVVSGKNKTDFLKSIDVFMLPSYFEGLPISMLECMSFGALPVVTPVGSIPEVVKDGENGIFIKVKDVGSIVDAVTRIHQNRNLLDTIGNEAKTTILEDFAAEKYVDELNRIYNSL